ncbi:MAG TPA: glycosyltransferase [Jatrophihabitantaceae bacterium]|nr:glycosyltransferase [Jatrophihabitantaceae bacterium]
MRIVLDGLPITGMSLAVVVEHLLEGWEQLDTGDEVHLVIGPRSPIRVPDFVHVHRVDFGKRHFVSRIRAQSVEVPRICRQVGADVMLGVLPTTTVTRLPCPRALIAYDIRHELRPDQFSTRARLMRTLSYSIGFRQADGIICISERTRRDLLRSRSWLSGRTVEVALLGADHTDSWPGSAAGVAGAPAGYAIAFGQYGNKNVDLVIEAWSLLHGRGEAMPLVVVGLGGAARAAAQARAAALGLDGIVEALPWLSDEQFRARFAGSSLVVFPSDFEGFGLPAIEAMRLGIPVVITPEQALLEVSSGHAVVMDGWGPVELADAVMLARESPPAWIAAATAHAADFTWLRTAQCARTALATVAFGAAAVASDPDSGSDTEVEAR